LWIRINGLLKEGKTAMNFKTDYRSNAKKVMVTTNSSECAFHVCQIARNGIGDFVHNASDKISGKAIVFISDLAKPENVALVLEKLEQAALAKDPEAEVTAINCQTAGQPP